MSRTGWPSLALLLICTFLAGCGTNVRWLLTEQGRLTPEADQLTTAAEGLSSGIERPVFDAEDKQLAACQFLTEAAAEAMQQKPSFGEQFVSDLSSVIVLLIPVAPVERCGDSIDKYRDSIARLKRELSKRGVVSGRQR
jgi:hypothetical protein